jgi:hypothetical protein
VRHITPLYVVCVFHSSALLHVLSCRHVAILHRLHVSDVIRMLAAAAGHAVSTALSQRGADILALPCPYNTTHHLSLCLTSTPRCCTVLEVQPLEL